MPGSVSAPLLANLYHWSPSTAGRGILRHGLRPRTETVVAGHPVPPNLGHYVSEDEAETYRAVCLGTTPAAAWALSGMFSAEPGQVWDLWEVNLADDDEVHIRTEYGPEMFEVRVLGSIPKSRCWFVGSRAVPARGSKWYAHPSALETR